MSKNTDILEYTRHERDESRRYADQLEKELDEARATLQPFADAAEKADAASDQQKRLLGSEISADASPGWGIRRKHLNAARAILAAKEIMAKECEECEGIGQRAFAVNCPDFVPCVDCEGTGKITKHNSELASQ